MILIYHITFYSYIVMNFANKIYLLMQHVEMAFWNRCRKDADL